MCRLTYRHPAPAAVVKVQRLIVSSFFIGTYVTARPDGEHAIGTKASRALTSIVSASIRLDSGGLDDAGPLFGFLYGESGSLGWCHRLRSIPIPARRAFIPGSATMAFISLLSFAITATGTRLGAAMPSHALAS